MKYKKQIKKELTKKEYSQFVKKVIDYNRQNGKMPEYIITQDDNTKIYKNEYVDAIENVNKFILENDREPEKVVIYEKKNSTL
ncbi:pseudomurein-binding repeat-containing protein [Methanosphaera cuniculi]|uniref:pseudomurein-binding repeat-containing protein n=1 Tax=Methanosphaera cuniculi TaxID=1077256 RepID=UPI0026ED7466|nr:pseudomurein-binding repeat-containing protein [Methanosphaera cuniculi]